MTISTPHSACRQADPPTVRQFHEARARELQREAVGLAFRQLGAWLRRCVVRACLTLRTESAAPASFTLQRRP